MWGNAKLIAVLVEVNAVMSAAVNGNVNVNVNVGRSETASSGLQSMGRV